MKTLLLLFVLTSLTSCFSSKDKSAASNASTTKDITPITSDIKVDDNGLSLTEASLKTKYGNIILKFYPLKAPSTTKRIMQLIKEGFYDGLMFHRVIPDFVAQGGDPAGTGMGGSGQKLKAEFNDLKHIEGTLAMARSQDPNSADSQFYIALTRLPHLDNKYTIFAQVVKGMKLIHMLKKGDKIISFTLHEE